MEDAEVQGASADRGSPRAAEETPGGKRRAGQKPRRRWLRWIGVLALVVVVVVAIESIPGAPGHDGAALAGELLVSDAAAALGKVDPFSGPPSGTCAKIESTYGVGNHLLKNNEIGLYASIWPSVQALNALYFKSLIAHSSRCNRDFQQNLKAIDDNYWAHSVAGMPSAYNQGPTAWHIPSDLPRVDDSLWMGLTVMRAYRRSLQPALLHRAEDVFTLAIANWDPHKGGIYWEDHGPGATNYDKAVVSNAPAAILGLDLYRVTGKRRYLQWSERIEGWVTKHLLDQATGLYNDHIDDHTSPPSVSKAKYTYNQGMMVGLLALLSRIDPQRYPLQNAVALAQRSMSYFNAHHLYGRQPAFDVVWAENVLWLSSLYQHESFSDQARASVKAAARAAPHHQASLLKNTSRSALEELVQLSPSSYHQLSP